MTYEDEERAYETDVNLVKQWWNGPRWRQTRRPFTAEQIVAKRGTIKIDYPSNIMSKKLWQILEAKYQVDHPTQSDSPIDLL